MTDPLKDLKGALKLASKILGATSPLVELASAQKAHQDEEEAQERATRAKGCRTCGGSGVVGKRTLIECPSCQGAIEAEFEPECDVCEDKKVVGVRGHQVKCPACS